MKIKNLLVSAFALTMVASCAPSEKPTDNGNVDKIIEGFETKVNGTAKLTFNSDYKVDVKSEKGGMDSFKHDIDDKVTAELDLTANNLYLYVKNDAKDGTVSKTREALVYKDGDTYKYVTTVMENPLELASEDAAKGKINELLSKISGNLAGYVDLSSLVFTKGGAYEHKEFGLSTSNIEVGDFISNPTIVSEGNGIKVNGDLDYIGYHTDGGISDFPGKDGAKASTYEIKTNDKGYVTSYSQTMNAALEMQIMTPAPLVTINGSKNLSATYGEELTKINTITHAKTTTKIDLKDSTQGRYEAFVTPTIGGEMTKISTGAELTVGQFLAVKVIPAGSNTIKMVTFAGTSKETPEADGYFYFEIPEGKPVNGKDYTQVDLTVNYIGADQNADVKFGTFTIDAPEGVTYGFNWFVLAGQAAGPMQDLVDGNKVPVADSHWLAVSITGLPENKVIDTVKIGEKNLDFIMGAYCFRTHTEGDYTIKVTLKDPAPVNEGKLVAPLAVTGAKVQYFKFPGMDFAKMAPVSSGDKLTTEETLAIKVIADNEDITVKSVKVNGSAETIKPVGETNGFYCFAVTSGDNKVEVEMQGTLPTTAVTKYTEVEGATLTITPFTLAGQAPAYEEPVAVGAELELGKFYQLDVTAAEGKTVEISVNGTKLAPGFGGKIFFQPKVAGTYEIKVVVK